MIRRDTPYIVVPMTTMDAILHQISLFRAVCPEHLKGSLEFAIKQFDNDALYMHGKENQNAKVKSAGYRL